MELREIISFLKEYIVLGIVALIGIGILFFVGYKIVYQKWMKGKKRITKKNLIVYGMSICYFAIVFGAVFLNRGKFYNSVNLHLFSSYLEAYHNMSMTLFRNLLLNIALFVPLGVFLPLYTQKLDKVYKVIPVGFLITLLIETMQYMTRLGIFEVDDILNNTLGVWIGYGLYKTYVNIKKKEKKSHLVGYLSPILIVILSFLVMFAVYSKQEFGNLPFEYNYKINMDKITVTNNIDLKNQKRTVPVYYLEPLTEKETRDIANTFYKNLGTAVREENIELYIYEDCAIYNSKNNQYSMWINYADGTYTFNDFTSFDKETEVKTDAKKEEVISALHKIGVSLPEESTFEAENGKYIFNVEIDTGDSITKGTLTCAYYKDDTVKRVNNNIVKYQKVKEKEIISETDAYNEIKKGKFQYNLYFGNHITLENIELKYDLDTKGYYVPVYAFKTSNEFNEIYIKAIQ